MNLIVNFWRINLKEDAARILNCEELSEKLNSKMTQAQAELDSISKIIPESSNGLVNNEKSHH